MKITDYADKLLEGLDRIDWPEETKKRQRDWIGRSEGAEIDFEIVGTNKKVRIFTTRPDTIFGATYMVLSPEHGLVHELKDRIENWKEVSEYIKATSFKTEFDRQIETEKTGVELKGIKAINPASGEPVPVWIADYVLAGYGTGAIMAVPAHDERDFAFAKKFGLEIRFVVGTEKAVYTVIEKSLAKDACERLAEFGVVSVEREDKDWGKFYKVTVDRKKEKIFIEFLKKHLLREAQDGGSWYADSVGTTNNAVFNGVDFDISTFVGLEKFKEHGRIVGVPEDQLDLDLTCFTENGICVNSDFLNDLSTPEAKEKIISWIEERGLGAGRVQYKLRDWSVSRQRFWGAPIPMLQNEALEIVRPQSPDFVLNLHAWGSNPRAEYHGWLDTMLTDQNIRSVTPALPNTNEPNFEEWLQAAKDALPDDTTNTVVTGRSLGCWTALALAQTARFRKIILVAPVAPTEEWYGRFNREGWDAAEKKIAEDFVDTKNGNLDFEKIAKNVDEVVVYLSTDDPYIPLEATKAFFEKNIPNVRVITQRESGHFDAGHGYSEFPHLLEEITRPIALHLRPIPESDLPVILPDDVDFKPTGQSPLTYSEEFNAGVEEKYGAGWKREPDTLDTFMCSSWYYFRYLDPHNDGAFASSDALKKWMPVDFYLGGAEHVNGHLLYSRFITKVLYDAGYIDFDEPFLKHRHQGIILGEDNRKMSKRWGNVINPTDVVNEYGADTCRMYEMFMGPLEDTKPWSTNGVKGVRRFLDRVWRLQEKIVNSVLEDKSMEILLNKTIKKVGEDFATLQFNTAVAKLMELSNAFGKLETITEQQFETFIILLAPLAPHIAEEMWQNLGHKDSVTTQTWPTYDASKLIDDMITIVVQVNGKVRANLEVSKDISEDEAKAAALADVDVQKWLDGKEPKKVIYVKGKLVSVVG